MRVLVNGSTQGLGRLAAAATSRGYWHHQHRQDPHPATLDPRFQDALAAHTQVHLT